MKYAESLGFLHGYTTKRPAFQLGNLGKGLGSTALPCSIQYEADPQSFPWLEQARTSHHGTTLDHVSDSGKSWLSYCSG